MPFACFGKRKKNKGKNTPIDKSSVAQNSNDANNANCAGVNNDTSKSDHREQPVVEESIRAVKKTMSMEASKPPSQQGGIQKSATLARYDFMKKNEFENTADRWAALRKQYLEPKMTISQHSESEQPTRASLVAKSLPRQFAPPSTVVSVVKFSQWFYERQIKEEEAKQEAQQREEKVLSVECQPVASVITTPSPRQSSQPEQEMQQQQSQPDVPQNYDQERSEDQVGSAASADAAASNDLEESQSRSEAEADVMQNQQHQNEQQNDQQNEQQSESEAHNEQQNEEQNETEAQDEQHNEQHNEQQNADGSLEASDANELNSVSNKLQSGSDESQNEQQQQQQQQQLAENGNVNNDDS